MQNTACNTTQPISATLIRRTPSIVPILTSKLPRFMTSGEITRLRLDPACLSCWRATAPIKSEQ
jgi:hypothetical protein